MSRLFTAPRAAHVHLDWDSQPVIRPGRSQRRSTVPAIIIAFAAGLLLGLLI